VFGFWEWGIGNWELGMENWELAHHNWMNLIDVRTAILVETWDKLYGLFAETNT